MFKDYYMSVLYPPDKAYVVADALSHIIMSILSNLEKAKKDLAREVHKSARLGLRSESSPDGGALVHHNSESSLVVEVKSKQHLDLSLMELSKTVLGKLNESFSLGGMVY